VQIEVAALRRLMAALCNAFKFNYGELEDCTMLLDIGAKTSNLLFFEKGKVFSRSINLGANAITQDFANESKLKFDEAEKIKIAEGFVSLGGAYEEPDNPHQAAISKIARQFMTKLHIQVNQTMQFYRGQQGGSAPQRLFLSGGASIMPYTAQFFAEKLNIPVEYFNPFRNVQIDPAVNLEDLSRVAHSFGEVVGLGLRNLANCPVEMNLMPESTLRWQALNEKKPYLVATVFSLVLVTFAIGFLFQQLASSKQRKLTRFPRKLRLFKKSRLFSTQPTINSRSRKRQAAQTVSLMQDRYYWGDFLAEMRSALIRAEASEQKKLSAEKPGVQVGVWVETMTSAADITGTGATQPPGAPWGQAPPMSRELMLAQRSGMTPAAIPTPTGTSTNTITLLCRAVSLTSVDPSANPDIAFVVGDEIRKSTLVDPKTTQVVGQISPDDANGTFTFTVNVTPQNTLDF
jgi:hypothetical protein